MTDNKEQSPESVFVAFTSVEKAGWTWNTTVRKGMNKTDIAGMFDLIEATQAEAVKRGYAYKAPVRGGFPAKKEIEYLPNPCPKCGNKLIKGSGKVESRCENNKWSVTEKKNIGSCDFISWRNETF